MTLRQQKNIQMKKEDEKGMSVKAYKSPDIGSNVRYSVQKLVFCPLYNTNI